MPFLFQSPTFHLKSKPLWLKSSNRNKWRISWNFILVWLKGASILVVVISLLELWPQKRLVRPMTATSAVYKRVKIHLRAKVSMQEKKKGGESWKTWPWKDFSKELVLSSQSDPSVRMVEPHLGNSIQVHQRDVERSRAVNPSLSCFLNPNLFLLSSPPPILSLLSDHSFDALGTMRRKLHDEIPQTFRKSGS